MKLILSNSWHWGIASSELFSALFLCFFLLASFDMFAQKNRFLLAVLIGLSIFSASIIGWTVGSQIGGKGNATAFASPLVALMQAIYYDAYDALWFIFCFQILGTICGICLFLVFRSVSGKFLESSQHENQSGRIAFFLKQPLGSWNQQLLRMTIVNSIFLIIVFTSLNLDFTAFNTGLLLNLVSLTIMSTFFGLLTSFIGFFSASPWLDIAFLGLRFAYKVSTKNTVVITTFNVIIQVALALIIGFIAYSIRHAQGLI